jgi:hypothetical protein
MNIAVNGANYMATDTAAGDPNALYISATNAAAMVRLEAGDTVDVRVVQNTADNDLSLLSGTWSHFAMTWIAP